MMQATINYLDSKIKDFIPEIAIILGSGLGSFCDGLEGISIKYSDIPNFGHSSVEGHKGELLFTQIHNKNCIIMQGRFHFYEGNPMDVLTYPIKVFKKMGVKTLIITNAAGAINPDFNVGDVMMISDHINFMGTNPLIGKNDETLGVRFPDMSDVYTKTLQKTAETCAQKLNIDLKKGIYLATTGPSYETKAEIKAYRLLGADVVGMSSVPEAIVASYLKMNVLGFSLITNHAAGVTDKKLSHNEVLEIGKTSGLKLGRLIKEVINYL